MGTPTQVRPSTFTTSWMVMKWRARASSDTILCNELSSACDEITERIASLASSCDNPGIKTLHLGKVSSMPRSSLNACLSAARILKTVSNVSRTNPSSA